MARVFGLWHGGANYGYGGASDVEVFPSLQAAKDALVGRAYRWYWQSQTFTYADGRMITSPTPNADDGASITVWMADPREDDGTLAYPDRMLTLGPRGGVSVGVC